MKKMRDIKVVIGANYGDEGKGYMTDYFCSQAKKSNRKCIVVLHNGGAQRGHTVELMNGTRHVFHHFGSGTFAGAVTYCADSFIINPITFREEWEELSLLGYTPDIYVNPYCRITTPWDMMFNQILEEFRGNRKHGSCGMGINETMKRCNSFEYDFRMTDVDTDSRLCNSRQHIERILYRVKSYYWEKINHIEEEYGQKLSDSWREIFEDKGICNRFIFDIQFMCEHIKTAANDILYQYTSIVFENSQGLLLDKNNLDNYPYLTPSNTGIMNPWNIVNDLFTPDEYEMEVCYVTRSYLTKHGAGPFPSECDKEVINGEMYDRTNIPNPHQDSLRYGSLNYEELQTRIEKDMNGINVVKALAITHMNEYYNGKNMLKELFGDYRIYMSFDRVREACKEYGDNCL